jgi:hypothetical protein
VAQGCLSRAFVSLCLFLELGPPFWRFVCFRGDVEGLAMFGLVGA